MYVCACAMSRLFLFSQSQLGNNCNHKTKDCSQTFTCYPHALLSYVDVEPTFMKAQYAQYIGHAHTKY